jgi:peptidoglycan hydrolase-like protein with peptidoglycan-binding domain
LGELQRILLLYLSDGAPVASQRVSGRLDKTTWKQWQTALREYGYRGRIDGVPGKMTYTAMQKWAGVKADGIIGPNTRRAVQSKLGVKPDGKWDKLTISELQRKLNTGKI